ncbi:hypothetical protein E2C01_099906 [Portunus trituberculatus]|uniref:Uncharacterized protein n=1 Tax=Portunus trituberculatus TaxID=210409 RepID=A0A5B7K508_PORTR|nr:hypothetical protein [Portunus trituberculatus]
MFTCKAKMIRHTGKNLKEGEEEEKEEVEEEGEDKEGRRRSKRNDSNKEDKRKKKKNRSIIKQLGGNQINGGVVRGTIFTTWTGAMEASPPSLGRPVQVEGQSEAHLRPACDQSSSHYNWNPHLTIQSSSSSCASFYTEEGWW